MEIPPAKKKSSCVRKKSACVRIFSNPHFGVECRPDTTTVLLDVGALLSALRDPQHRAESSTIFENVRKRSKTLSHTPQSIPSLTAPTYGGAPRPPAFPHLAVGFGRVWRSCWAALRHCRRHFATTASCGAISNLRKRSKTFQYIIIRAYKPVRAPGSALRAPPRTPAHPRRHPLEIAHPQPKSCRSLTSYCPTSKISTTQSLRLVQLHS